MFTTSDQQKQAHGAVVSITWMVISVVLFISDGNLLSLTFAAFFVVGSFVSAIVLGPFFYSIQRAVASGLASSKPRDAATLQLAQVLGYVFFAAEIVVTVGVAYFIFTDGFQRGGYNNL